VYAHTALAARSTPLGREREARLSSESDQAAYAHAAKSKVDGVEARGGWRSKRGALNLSASLSLGVDGVEAWGGWRYVRETS
jgi:hypothetical protein